MRLLILYEYGGIYMDLDYEVHDWNYLRALTCEGTTWFCEEQIFYEESRNYYIGNWFLCSPKGSP